MQEGRRLQRKDVGKIRKNADGTNAIDPTNGRLIIDNPADIKDIKFSEVEKNLWGQRQIDSNLWKTDSRTAG